MGTLIQYIHFFLPCQLQCCLSSLCKSTFKQEKFLAQFYYFSIGVSPSPSDSQTAHLYSVKCQVLFKPISAYIELISLQHCLVICEQNHVQKTHWKFDYPFLPFIVS